MPCSNGTRRRLRTSSPPATTLATNCPSGRSSMRKSPACRDRCCSRRTISKSLPFTSTTGVIRVGTRVATRVPTLMTPVVLVNGKDFEIVRREQHRSLHAGDFLMELRPLGQFVASVVAGGLEVRKRLRVPFEHGIHARPAALLVRALREFSADVSALAHNRKANARSAVAWMELGVRRGDEVTLVATGRDAEAALAALETMFVAPVAARPEAPLAASRVADGVLRGVIASRGLATGPAARIAGAAPAPSETGAGVAHENAALDRARALVRAELERFRGSASGTAREVLDAHLVFIDDPELLQLAHASIARGKSASRAWNDAVEQSVQTLIAVGDPRVTERADDLHDLARQVLRALAGGDASRPLHELPSL